MAKKNPLNISYKRNRKNGKNTFVNGAPQLVFTTKKGTTFTRTYTTKANRQKAVKNWMAKGGTRPKFTKLRK